METGELPSPVATVGVDKAVSIPVVVSDVSVCETNRGTWIKEGFGSSFNLRSEDEIEI